MPRRARLDAPGWLHHVVARGIERRPIFLDDEDQLDFLVRLERLVRDRALSVYAWALMWNHFHLLCRTGNQPLGRSMSSLLTGYAGTFNRRHRRVGHLFQNRFKSVVCEDGGYFRELVRYIHLNPVRAELVADVDGLDRYRWTGHAAIMGHAPVRMLDVERVLSAFGPSPDAARSAYRRFLVVGLEPAEQEATRKGRAWKHLAFLAREVQKAERDDRILGSDAFFRQIRGNEPAETPMPPSDPPRAVELGDLFAIVAEHFGVDSVALAAGSKRPACARAREAISHLWIDVLGRSYHDLVPVLGVGETAIHKAAKRGRSRRDRLAAVEGLANLGWMRRVPPGSEGAR